MSVKKRSVLLSVMTVVLCLALVAGGTYALFSDRVTLNNHLVAGTMDIKLERTSLVTKSLDTSTGFLVDTANTELIDFSEAWDPAKPELKNENIFDITGETLIVPGSKYTANMKISNGGDVAYGYWLEIKINSTDLTLANQIKITVKTVDSQKSIDAKWLATNAGLLGGEDSPIGILAISDVEEFTVIIEFADDAAADNDDMVGENNDAMGKTAAFDLVVHAVQITTDPQQTPAPTP